MKDDFDIMKIKHRSLQAENDELKLIIQRMKENPLQRIATVLEKIYCNM